MQVIRCGCSCEMSLSAVELPDQFWPHVADRGKTPMKRGYEMSPSRSDDPVTRPTMCPFCDSKIIDTLAKVITASALWRCRECERTWTIASLAATWPRAH